MRRYSGTVCLSACNCDDMICRGWSETCSELYCKEGNVVMPIERMMTFIVRRNLSYTESGNNGNLSLAKIFYIC